MGSSRQENRQQSPCKYSLLNKKQQGDCADCVVLVSKIKKKKDALKV